MDNPELSNDEAVLANALKIFVKSIPFEGILTNKRIILTDREKNLLLPKTIPLGNIRDTDTGEDKNHNPTLTLSVLAKTGVTRQMVLTFPRQPRGRRNRERDEWGAFIREIISQLPEPYRSPVVPDPEPVAKRAGTTGASGSVIVGVPVQTIVTAPKKRRTPEPSGSGNITMPVPSKVLPPKNAGIPGASGSVIASVPVQPDVTASQPPVAPKAKDRMHPSRKIQEQVIVSPATPPEPVKQDKSVHPARHSYCPQCGTRVPLTSLFCHRCGAGIAPSS